MSKINNKSVDRIIDANFNRAKEGLRVCEDVCRFWLDDSSLTRSLKNCRHELTKILDIQLLEKLLASRDIERDVGRGTIRAESKRTQMSDVIYANFQRVKESVRVLEEIMKLKNSKISIRLKKLRYKVYELEKKISKAR